MTENKNKGGGEQNLTVSLIEYIEPFIFEMKKKDWIFIKLFDTYTIYCTDILCC